MCAFSILLYVADAQTLQEDHYTKAIGLRYEYYRWLASEMKYYRSLLTASWIPS